MPYPAWPAAALPVLADAIVSFVVAMGLAVASSLATLATVALATLTAGAWYARRRWRG